MAEPHSIPLSSSMLAFDDEWNSTSIAVMQDLEVLDGLLVGWNASEHRLHGRARITTRPDASVQLDFNGTSITVFGLASPATAPLSISLDESVQEVSHPNTNASLSRIVLFQASQLPQQLHSLQIQHAGDESELLAMTGVEIQPRVGEDASSLPYDAIANAPSLAPIVGNATQTDETLSAPSPNCTSLADSASRSIADPSTIVSSTVSNLIAPTLISSFTSDALILPDFTSYYPHVQEMASSPVSSTYIAAPTEVNIPVVPSVFTKQSSEKVDFQQNTLASSSSSSRLIKSSSSLSSSEGLAPTVQSDQINTSSAPSVKQIAATLCGSLAGLAFLLLLIYICIRRRRRKSAQPIPPRMRFTSSPSSSIDYSPRMRQMDQNAWTTFARTASSSGHGSSDAHTPFSMQSSSSHTHDPYLQRKSTTRLTVANPDSSMRRPALPMHSYILEETDSRRASLADLTPPVPPIPRDTAGTEGTGTPVEIKHLQFGVGGARAHQQVFWSLN